MLMQASVPIYFNIIACCTPKHRSFCSLMLYGKYPLCAIHLFVLSDVWFLHVPLLFVSFCFHSFVDLPNLAASIYSVELSNRLRAFLVACPPAGPASPVSDLVVATADFQKDLSSWNIW